MDISIVLEDFVDDELDCLKDGLCFLSELGYVFDIKRDKTGSVILTSNPDKSLRKVGYNIKMTNEEKGMLFDKINGVENNLKENKTGNNTMKTQKNFNDEEEGNEYENFTLEDEKEEDITEDNGYSIYEEENDYKSNNTVSKEEEKQLFEEYKQMMINIKNLSDVEDHSTKLYSILEYLLDYMEDDELDKVVFDTINPKKKRRKKDKGEGSR